MSRGDVAQRGSKATIRLSAPRNDTFTQALGSSEAPACGAAAVQGCGVSSVRV